MPCRHKEFDANVNVNVFQNTGQWNAEIQVTCRQCRTPFHFIGAPQGISMKRPTVEPGGFQLRAPIAPGPRQVKPKLIVEPGPMRRLPRADRN